MCASAPTIHRHISLKISIFSTFTSVPLVSQFLKRVILLVSTHIMFSSLLPFSEVGRLVFWRRDLYMPLVLFGFFILEKLVCLAVLRSNYSLCRKHLYSSTSAFFYLNSLENVMYFENSQICFIFDTHHLKDVGKVCV